MLMEIITIIIQMEKIILIMKNITGIKLLWGSWRISFIKGIISSAKEDILILIL